MTERTSLLHGIIDGQLESISSSQLKHMHATHAIAEFYQLHMCTASPSLNLDYSSLNQAVISLIKHFEFLFYENLSIPPKRDTDHMIHLPTGAGPVDVRP